MFPQIRGTFFGGSHNKDYSIFGVYIGVPLFWETTICGLGKLVSYEGHSMVTLEILRGYGTVGSSKDPSSTVAQEPPLYKGGGFGGPSLQKFQTLDSKP